MKKKSVLFVPDGVRLEVKNIDDRLAIVIVDGCAPSELRIWQGDLEIQLEELKHGKEEG